MPTSRTGLNTIYISERVQECLRPIAGCALTEVVAPMGYGKTTAIDWFLAARKKAENAAVVRISIYAPGLGLLWKRAQTAFAFAGYDLLSGCRCPDDDDSAALLTDELCRGLAGERPVYIFIDDFHLLGDGRCAEFICRLAHRLPENVHIIVASRDRFLPGSEIVRLGCRLHRLGAGQLRLSEAELLGYARRAGIELSPAQLGELMRSSEGWFSAVYLNLRALSERGALLGGDSDIYEMFTSALLDPLGERERRFLAIMSSADEFTPEMARSVTQMEDVGALLAALTEQNAFVTRLPEGRSYRFHHMLKTCAGRLFEALPEDERLGCFERFGEWYEREGQYLHALDAYEKCGDRSAWLRVVAEDAGVMLAALEPERVLAWLGGCPEETLKSDPAALLVLMRRLFSWGRCREMLGLRQLLLEAVGNDAELDETERGNLLGECDLIMSFLRYNDIAGMSELHRSACRLMSRPAVSIRTYGSFTFGSPSVLMMFHRTPGALEDEVRTMNEAMPYYYRVTDGHGAGAELVMQAEALLMRGELAAAGLICARAVYETEQKQQSYIRLCCEMVLHRLELLGGTDPLPGRSLSAAQRSRDATLIRTGESIDAFYYALLGLADKLPPLFSRHGVGAANILNPARPMLEMIENQVCLAQGEYAAVTACSERLLEKCRAGHYCLVETHVLIQTAAAYAMLGCTDEALPLLEQATELALDDGILTPFAENHRYIAPLMKLLTSERQRAFAARAAELGERFERRCAILRARLGRPAAAEGLSDRELEIARMAASRATNREIAERLFLSEGTVKQYINQIYSKLHISGDTRTKRRRLTELLSGRSAENAKM